MAVKIRPKGSTATNAYWREREIRQGKRNRSQASLYKRRIESQYRKALYEIQKEIDAFYLKYATSEGLTLADAKKRISATDITEWKNLTDIYDGSKESKAYLKLLNATARINRLEYLKAKIGLKLLNHHDIMMHFFDDTLTYEAMLELERQAGRFGEFTGANPAQRVKSIVNSSFHSATWSDRLWGYQGVLKSTLDNILTRGLIIGRNPKHPEFVKSLQKAFDVSKYEAQRLLVTEMARVQMDVQKNSFIRNGYKEYEYICCAGGSGKNPNDPCSICRELDGKVFKVSEMMPGENAPPMHPNCHCSVAAWMED